MSMYGHIVLYYIPSAWASALLILLDWACESLYTRDKQSGRFPRSFYMVSSTQLLLQRQGITLGKSCARHELGNTQWNYVWFMNILCETLSTVNVVNILL